MGLSFSMICSGQAVSVPDGYEAKENLRELGTTGNHSVKTFDNRYEGVRGTPYVFADWMPGEVYLDNKNKVTVNKLNYNCFNNEIAYMDPATQVVRLMNRYKVDLFVITGQQETKTFVPVKLEEGSEPVFARLLYNQGSLVYKVFRKEFLQANYEGGYSADRKYDEFVDKSDLYFMKQGDRTLYKVKKSKKYMIASFAEREKEISSYLKSNKPDLKDEDAIVKLLEFYDSL